MKLNNIYILITILIILGIAGIVIGLNISNEYLFLLGGIFILVVSCIMLGDY